MDYLFYSFSSLVFAACNTDQLENDELAIGYFCWVSHQISFLFLNLGVSFVSILLFLFAICLCTFRGLYSLVGVGSDAVVESTEGNEKGAVG